MHDKHDNGSMMQFVVSGLINNEILAHGEWSKTLDRATLEKVMEGYMIPSLRKPFVEVYLLVSMGLKVLMKSGNVAES